MILRFVLHSTYEVTRLCILLDWSVWHWRRLWGTRRIAFWWWRWSLWTDSLANRQWQWRR